MIMKTIHYQIEFFSYWHAGSGLSSNTYSDMLVNKTRDGFPYVPGRTLKGLLREAAETINILDETLVTTAFISDVFGQAPTQDDLEAEKITREALSFFGSGLLSDYLRSSISENQKPLLYNVVSATSIGTDGVAKESSLRQMEVTIPLVLFARIEGFPEEEGYVTQLAHCFGWIKSLGLNRSRGLGRCKFSLLKTE